MERATRIPCPISPQPDALRRGAVGCRRTRRTRGRACVCGGVGHFKFLLWAVDVGCLAAGVLGCWGAGSKSICASRQPAWMPTASRRHFRARAAASRPSASQPRSCPSPRRYTHTVHRHDGQTAGAAPGPVAPRVEPVGRHRRTPAARGWQGLTLDSLTLELNFGTFGTHRSR